MSERQVRYTDGSWSREVEVTDDLLDEATRLADLLGGRVHSQALSETLRALTERVRAAETERDQTYWHGWTAGRAARFDDPEDNFDRVVAERDAARGKLDAVRALHRLERPTGNLVTDETPPYCGGCYEAGGYDGAPLWEDCPTLAILDGAE